MSNVDSISPGNTLTPSRIDDEGTSGSSDLPPTEPKAVMSKLALTGVFFGFFVFFLYVSFPYAVLKEFGAAWVTKQTGIRFRMDDLGPALPLGVAMEGIEVEGRDPSRPVKLKSVKLRVNILPLLIGRVGGSLQIRGEKSGALDASVGLGLFDLIGGKISPRVSLEGTAFPVDGLAAFGLGMLAEKQGATNPIIRELLENIILVGSLQGDVKIDIDADNPIQSSGAVDLALQGAGLSFLNKSLNISEQNFEIAAIKANISEGVLNISNESRFKSQGLDFEVSGKVILKEPMDASQVDVKLALRLDSDLKQNYGFLLGSEGEMAATIGGTFRSVEFNKR